MLNPLEIPPIIDSGSDTAARYRYQAEVTLPFCLNCALGTDIYSVVPEHIEDICLEGVSSWRFIQVKSRNPDLGLWILSDLVSKGGALRSLYRTHKQTETVSTSLEMILEGATKPKDLIEELKADGNHESQKLVSRVLESLEITADAATSFLKRVVILRPPPPRQFIRDSNIALIQQQNVDLSYQKVVRIYEELIAEIERAMRAEALGPNWPSFVKDPASAMPMHVERLNAKRLTRAMLRQKVSPLSTQPRQLLKQITDSSSSNISILERKLAAGGATDGIKSLARDLHANAQSRLLSLQSANLFPNEDIIADLNQRLKTYAISKAASYERSQKPAIEIWNSLLSELTANVAGIDLNKLMGADPLLLLGQVCDLSDNCVLDWGKSHED